MSGAAKDGRRERDRRLAARRNAIGTLRPATANSEIRWTKSSVFVKQTPEFEIKETMSSAWASGEVSAFKRRLAARQSANGGPLSL